MAEIMEDYHFFQDDILSQTSKLHSATTFLWFSQKRVKINNLEDHMLQYYFLTFIIANSWWNIIWISSWNLGWQPNPCLSGLSPWREWNWTIEATWRCNYLAWEATRIRHHDRYRQCNTPESAFLSFFHSS